MVVWFLFALWAGRADLTAGNYTGIGGHLLIFVLLALLGWKVFGPLLSGG